MTRNHTSFTGIDLIGSMPLNKMKKIPKSIWELT